MSWASFAAASAIRATVRSMPASRSRKAGAACTAAARKRGCASDMGEGCRRRARGGGPCVAETLTERRSGMHRSPMPRVLTTDAVAARERLAYWNDAVSDAYVRLDTTAPGGDVVGDIRVDALATLELSRVKRRSSSGAPRR